MAAKQSFWISWFATTADVSFELHSPWWVSGERQHPQDEDDSQDIICAAVRADTEEEAMALVVAAHDKPVELEWRFCELQKPDWSPFNSRFRQAGWMKWT